MWRSSYNLLKQIRVNTRPRLINNPNKYTNCLINRPNYANFFPSFCTGAESKRKENNNDNESANTTAACSEARKTKESGTITAAEARKLMRLVDVEALKVKLGTEGKEVISYRDLLQACRGYGVAKSDEEATVFARVLDDAGVVLLFRDKVYLHPDKVYSFAVFAILEIYPCFLHFS